MVKKASWTNKIPLHTSRFLFHINSGISNLAQNGLFFFLKNGSNDFLHFRPEVSTNKYDLEKK